MTIVRSIAFAACCLLLALTLSAPPSGAASNLAAAPQSLETLKSKGAKIVSAAELRRKMRRFGLTAASGQAEFKQCGQAACYCEGASSCADLVASGKCGDDFHCASTNEGPACVCTQK